jgi:hypothetical protein
MQATNEHGTRLITSSCLTNNEREKQKSTVYQDRGDEIQAFLDREDAGTCRRKHLWRSTKERVRAKTHQIISGLCKM